MSDSSMQSLHRRDFLKIGAAAMGLGLAVSGPAAAAEEKKKKKIPIGLQLYSVRNQCA